MKSVDEILAEIATANRRTAEELARSWHGEDLARFLADASAAVKTYGPAVVRLAIALSGVL